MKMIATLMRTIATKMMRNKQILIDLPYAQSKDFALVLESVKSPMTPNGKDIMYGLKNKITGVVELRGYSLALAVVMMQNQQQMFDRVLSGEMNGFTVSQQPPLAITDGSVL
jgi:hypothetical protein